MKRIYPKALILSLEILSIGLLSSCGFSELTNHDLSPYNSSDFALTPTSIQTFAESSILLSPPEDISCTHFVVLNGEDGNLGTESEPWGSFQYAAEFSLTR